MFQAAILPQHQQQQNVIHEMPANEEVRSEHVGSPVDERQTWRRRQEELQRHIASIIGTARHERSWESDSTDAG